MAWLFGIIAILLFVALFFYVRRRRAELADEEAAREQAFFDLIRQEHRGGEGREIDTPVAQAPVHGSDRPMAERQIQSDPAGIEFSPPPPPAMGAMDEIDSTTGSSTAPVYLERSHLLVWRWLRTALPEHECFARGSLRRVVGRERARKDMMVDFVICDAACQVVAVVDLERRGVEPAVPRFKQELLNEVGVRYACWSPSQLPERDEVRDWIRRPVA